MPHCNSASEGKGKVQKEQKPGIYSQNLPDFPSLIFKKGKKNHLCVEMLYCFVAFTILVYTHTYLTRTQDFTLHSWKLESILWKAVTWSKLKSRLKRLNALKIFPQTVGIHSNIFQLPATPYSLCNSTRGKSTKMKF